MPFTEHDVLQHAFTAGREDEIFAKHFGEIVADGWGCTGGTLTLVKMQKES